MEAAVIPTGSMIKAWRQTYGLSQQQVAKQMNVSQPTLCRLEKEDLIVSTKQLERLWAFSSSVTMKIPKRDSNSIDIDQLERCYERIRAVFSFPDKRLPNMDIDFSKLSDIEKMAHIICYCHHMQHVIKKQSTIEDALIEMVQSMFGNRIKKRKPVEHAICH